MRSTGLKPFSSQTTLFHESWWLDAVAPGRWDQVAVDSDGEAEARWRFALRRRAGLRQLGAPALSPYLGPETRPGDGKPATRIGHDIELKQELLRALPRFDVLLAGSTPTDTNHLPFTWGGVTARPRITYELSQLHDLDARWAGLGESTRRAIRKAEKRVTVVSTEHAADLHAMMTASFTRQGRRLPVDRDLLERVVDQGRARDRVRALSATDERGQLHAAALIAWDHRRSYYLGGGADPELRSSGAQSLLLWEAIKHAAATSEIFDFEGSMVPGIERFFRGFGGAQRIWFQYVAYGRLAGAGQHLVAAGRSLVGR